MVSTFHIFVDLEYFNLNHEDSQHMIYINYKQAFAALNTSTFVLCFEI